MNSLNLGLKMVKIWMDFVRFSHTIFALPFALAAMFVAAEGLPQWHVFLIILVCMVTARNCAMAFNRLVDRDIDAKNPRTVNRHLVSGELSLFAVYAFIIANGLVFCFSTYFLNPLALMLSLPTLLALMSYSLWKRFSYLCHLFLGFAIGLSPSGAWVAVKGELDLFPVVLGLILALWIAGFDIIYATQDEEVDRELKLHSIPARFGTRISLRIALVIHFTMLIMMLWFGFIREWNVFSIIELGLVSLILGYIHLFRQSNSLDALNKDFFLANGAISVIMMLSLVADAFY